MGGMFWELVVDELEYQDKPRKWLAAEVGIDVSTIGMGLRHKSVPQIDLAIKIAKALHVPVEYLVTGKYPHQKHAHQNEDYHKYHKYARLIESLDSLPPSRRIPIINMIEEMDRQMKYENK